MEPSRLAPPRGSIAMALLLAMFVACGAFAAVVLAASALDASRDRATERALALAREALVAYAVDRPIDPVVGPGYLPCPDLDGDGWAESTCGSLAGDSGQAQRLGLLPWKTLGIPEVRDGAGEPLWYAVATKYKGLLNCAASRACVDLTPVTAVGTITVRDAAGTILHDGTLADARAPGAGAVAVVIAPGAPLARWAGFFQRRGCVPAPCPVAQYLDAAPWGEDNASFVDRNDGLRTANRDGFIAGPVVDAAGQQWVNDRVAVVRYADLMPRVMARVALEAGHCLRLAAQRDGVLPAPAPVCGEAWGRVPPLGAIEGCMLAADAASGWWEAWRPYVAYAAAPGCDGAADCIALVDREGRAVASDYRLALTVGPEANACAAPLLRCDAARCTQVSSGAGLDVSIALR